MTIEQMMARLGQPGWGKFDNVGESFEAQQKAIREQVRGEALDVAACFESEVGKRCLELLVRQFFFKSDLLPLGGAVTLEQQAMHSAYRQGQKDLVAMILNAIAVARGGKAELQRGEQ